MSRGIACPVCGHDKATLVRHCPSERSTCSWSICSVCRATVDRVRTDDGVPRHGHPTERVERDCLLCHPHN